ncbi:MAG: cytochrome c biogenesis protein CcsA [Bacteroidaceae bacterium]|nr:cytochrome c biogenesis protein CcsA [Bacteroidaceae bacterium]
MKVNLLKYLSFGSLALLLVVLVASTLVGAVWGAAVAHEYIYSSPLFAALWAVMLVSSLLYIFKTPMRRVAASLFLHLVFAVVLVGAFVTYCTAERGRLNLCKEAAPASMFVTDEGSLAKFPFRLLLKDCRVEYYEDGVSPRDYFATLAVLPAVGDVSSVSLSMNNVYDRAGYRFCLSSVDDDCVTLLVSHDPWGVPISYAGYLFTVIGFIFLFVARNTQKRVLMQRLVAIGYPRINMPSFHWWQLVAISMLLFVVIGYLGILRWADSGVFPVSNSAEVMMFIAWCAFFAVFFFRTNRTLAFGAFVLALICAIVSFSSGVGASGPVQPVLRTPLLPLHVIAIILSYVFIGLLAVNALVALVVYWLNKDYKPLENTAVSGRVMLYYATWLLVAGIFLGAAWANISWGRYWGWDPKEVWALITLLVCSAGFHTRSLPFMARPLVFHAFCLVAFLVMLFTFFGVNYLLGGLHSYA